ncbi:zinc-binding metallopeptidase family protein [Achromobacter xylosoxidans]|uniref:hypothetical protein n=1 Tax=Alcaligenes xylosoxydans xylosoxydans TaxID=85698 RepID=UPI0003D5C1F6|nr:hypothetical protein [Achromobacter xylosoxidans]AHC49716.1 hypothetical protein AX27061_5261 [Achromobacter xylosoxidans NBRC 15126 = ATCC 27061]QKQ53951.1 PA domain protein [Achromobacter xylosoxidans]QPR96903.1 PA domain protein [Achromobacter xylosoxidans]UON40846.1 PA domain protein [Achromobacter xylosoxidans]CKI13305.1 Uncharacterised protein [Achromobacter xylosoxidans]
MSKWRNLRGVCGAVGCVLLAACASGPQARGPQALPAQAAMKVDGREFLPREQVRRWQEELDAMGLRDTGSPAHERYVDQLHERLLAAGVRALRFESLPLARWSARHWALQAADGERIAVAGYVPYSGRTGAQGREAGLVYLPPGAAPDQRVAGKIVLFDLPRATLTGDFFHRLALRAYDPAGSLPPGAPYARPYQVLEVLTALQEKLQAAGAVGAIAIIDAPAQTAEGLYAPYDRELRAVPALYVDRDAGRRLKALAAKGAALRLTLDAQVEQVRTRNLIGVIPGATDEWIVINSHTDGTNGIEDNGPNAIVDMAGYLSRLPRSSLPRGVMIMLSSGHFAGGAGVQDFLARHQGDALASRIAAVVTIEHLGAMEWLPDATGKLAPTGKFEPVGVFMPPIPALVDAAEAMVRQADAGPAFIMPPLNPKGDGGPNNAVWPGEGQYFWGRGRIPTINYISGPNYLLNYGVTTADKVDYARMQRETVAATQLLLDLSRVPFGQLRPEPAAAR